MKLQFILLAGVATAAISFVPFTTAMAGSYDDQVEETRALNIEALAAARGESDMSQPDVDTGAADDRNGQGGPYFEGPPDSDDLGDEPFDDDDMDGPDADEAVDAEDAPDDDDGAPE